MTPRELRCLGLVESWEDLALVTPVEEKRQQKVTTHNRLLYSSMQLQRALVRRTMMQLLVKTWLCQSELGINAVRFFFIRCCIHPTNDGIDRPLMESRAMLEALWILLRSADNDLKLCLQPPVHHQLLYRSRYLRQNV